MTIFNSKKIYFIVGPTASGKTLRSIELAKQINNAEIISADSRQIYRDLNLSTGKITKEEMEGIPHHMLDIVNPGEYFSVVDYTNLALQKIDEVFKRGNTPIVVGGTGFYIDSLLYDYNLPEVKANQALRKELEGKDNLEMFEMLKNLDPSFALAHDNNEFKNNKHRLARAIEIAIGIGHVPVLKKKIRFTDTEIINITMPRDILKLKIYKRLLERLDAGMVKEVASVKEKYNLEYKYFEGLGLEFKWISKYLKDEITKEDMIENLNKQIYQYARRQEAWFKRYKNMLYDDVI